MLTEKNDPNNPFEYSPDLFAEPHDHANMWDISAFWAEVEEQSADDETLEPPVAE